jgi:hypothetical protein
VLSIARPGAWAQGPMGSYRQVEFNGDLPVSCRDDGTVRGNAET